MIAELPTVLLVDDHPLFRQGLRMLLAASPELQAQFQEAESIDAALALAALPALVLLDISMPGGDGIKGIARLRAHWPEARIVMLSGYDHPELMRDAKQQGASGFLSKAHAPAVLVTQVKQWLGQAQEAGGAPPHPENPGIQRLPSLPPRQYEVLKLVAEGFSNKAIARRLDVSENTIRNQVVAILRHFDAQTRTQAVTSAQRHGLLPMGFTS